MTWNSLQFFQTKIALILIDYAFVPNLYEHKNLPQKGEIFLMILFFYLDKKNISPRREWALIDIKFSLQFQFIVVFALHSGT